MKFLTGPGKSVCLTFIHFLWCNGLVFFRLAVEIRTTARYLLLLTHYGQKPGISTSMKSNRKLWTNPRVRLLKTRTFRYTENGCKGCTESRCWPKIFQYLLTCRKRLRSLVYQLIRTIRHCIVSFCGNVPQEVIWKPFNLILTLPGPLSPRPRPHLEVMELT